MKTIRILLVEDNRILREGIPAMINGEEDMRVVASSGGADGTFAVRMTKREREIMPLIAEGLSNKGIAR